MTRVFKNPDAISAHEGPESSRSDAAAPHACCPASAHCARQAEASKGSAKYCTSRTTPSARFADWMASGA